MCSLGLRLFCMLGRSLLHPSPSLSLSHSLLQSGNAARTAASCPIMWHVPLFTVIWIQAAVATAENVDSDAAASSNFPLSLCCPFPPSPLPPPPLLVALYKNCIFQPVSALPWPPLCLRLCTLTTSRKVVAFLLFKPKLKNKVDKFEIVKKTSC